MPRLEWGNPEDRVFETGISNAVLYVDGGTGVAWNGLVSIVEKSEGGEPRSFYYDGLKFKQRFSNETFEATLEAYTYPTEFMRCEGVRRVRSGFYVGQQHKTPFGLCYRTNVGDGVSAERGYKLHLVYNAWAFDSEKSRETQNENVEALLFSWEITTVPALLDEFKPSAYFVLDSRELPPQTMELVEGYLYGNDIAPATLPSPDEILGLLNLIPDGLTVVDNGDGTFTITGTDQQVELLDEGMFSLDSNSVEVSGDTYSAASA